MLAASVKLVAHDKQLYVGKTAVIRRLNSGGAQHCTAWAKR
jgi:hypothetical protein